jgi:alpha-L-rhamnosidase
VALRAELRDEALGVASAEPRLSWKVETERPSWRQRAYELELDRGGGFRSAGVVESDESVLVAWPFEPLRSRERVDVRVRVWGPPGVPSAWSEPLSIEAGLLRAGDWRADFVGPDWHEDLTAPQPAPYLRHEFDLDADVVQGRLYVTALGVYEPYINGSPVGDEVLPPGWTSYDHRLRVQTFDVTAQLHRGRNAIGAILADGWYRGRLGPHGGRRNIYGDCLALLAQLELVHADGTTTIVCTDGTWRAATGPVLTADLYDGETYDARLELPGWAAPGFDDGAWRCVRRVDRDLSTLVAPLGPPVRRTEVVAPTAITRSPTGKLLVDFGQNLVGRVRIRARGERGDMITLRHAEILEHGELCVRPLRQAAATDRYILRADGEDEMWEPRFTFHGFRYAEVDGLRGELAPEDVCAVVCHSDLTPAGTFDCSAPLVNRLHRNVVWSMRGNFLDVPTDCAQRDERLGWTGDVQVFAPTALFLYDTAGFLGSWLADLAAEQFPDGRVPNVVPQVLDGLRHGLHDHDAPAAGWGDAAVIVPWTIYRFTGDRRILEQQYGSMRAWVDLVERLAGADRLWDSDFQYGDWLDPTAPSDRPERGQTDPALVATAYFARSSEVLADVARVLGRDDDRQRYAALSDEVAAAFRRVYVRADGRLRKESATGYAIALVFGLVEGEAARDEAGRRLVQLVSRNGYRISTGFVGTPLICDALCGAGAVEVAYRLLLQQECPSWLYPLTMGATTIWERWDSMLQDGSVNPGEMTSFNHYAFGAVADWLHRQVAGLAPAEPGFREIAIRPQIGGGLTQARASHETPYGRAEVGWRIVSDALEVEATIPPNTVATVTLPGQAESFRVGSGVHQWRAAVPAIAETLVAARE